MGIDELEKFLRSLLGGEFSSLTLSFNELNGPNYQTVAETIAEDDAQDENVRYLDWVSDAEKQKSAATNSLWVLHWYPHTPVGFNTLAASSIAAIIEALSAQKPA